MDYEESNEEIEKKEEILQEESAVDEEIKQEEPEKEETKKHQEDDKKLQHAIIDIKNKFGKNSILKGMNLEEGSTAIDRNREVGGHKG